MAVGTGWVKRTVGKGLQASVAKTTSKRSPSVELILSLWPMGLSAWWTMTICLLMLVVIDEEEDAERMLSSLMKQRASGAQCPEGWRFRQLENNRIQTMGRLTID